VVCEPYPILNTSDFKTVDLIRGPDAAFQTMAELNAQASRATPAGGSQGLATGGWISRIDFFSGAMSLGKCQSPVSFKVSQLRS
jgi:hypothetical protein